MERLSELQIQRYYAEQGDYYMVMSLYPNQNTLYHLAPHKEMTD